MSKHVPPPQGPRDIEKIDLKEALEERYLAYALSTIMHRALPDVRDGLKPHARVYLYPRVQRGRLCVGARRWRWCEWQGRRQRMPVFGCCEQ